MQPVKMIGSKYKCPVCGKEFRATTDTCYIIRGQYTCSWKCFLDEVNMRENIKPKKKQL